MKPLILLLLTLASFSLTAHSESGEMKLSGKIDHPNSDSLAIMTGDWEVVNVFRLDEERGFGGVFNVSPGYYYLYDGEESTEVYLRPGYDMSVYFNAEQFDETMAYTGTGAAENNFLAKKTLSRESLSVVSNFGYYTTLDEGDFLALMDSVTLVEQEFFEKNSSGLDGEFSLVEEKEVEFSHLERLVTFQSLKRYITGDKSYTVSESYPDVSSEVDMSNDSYLHIPAYLDLVESVIHKRLADRFQEQKYDYVSEELKIIREEVESVELKEELAFRLGEMSLDRSDDLDVFYGQLMALISDEEYRATITKKYEKFKMTAEGRPSPPFEFMDIKGESVSLSDLRGHVVYIDIWATWCYPCIKEIPDLKEVQAHFKSEDVAFVSICKSDTEERWRAMVEKEELGGYQLFTTDNDHDFFKSYSLNGIPRFILIDREGNIIDANAQRPSDPGLIQTVEDNL